MASISPSPHPPSSWTLSNPPPPPPKPSQSQQPATGPPPRPPPPPSPYNQEQQQQTQQGPSTPHPSHPPPPSPSENWLPPVCLDKPSSTLHSALSNPPLLSALSQTHPSLTPSPLPPHLTHTTTLATHLTHQHAHLLSLRQKTQTHLLHCHALERQWRDKQAQMDKELAPWSAKALYQRLREAEREGEEMGRGMEVSWLDGEGVVGEREVGEFLRGFREVKGRGWRRREWLERWDEGRVGGWR